MGNCQASDAVMLMIQHPCGTLERVYFSVSARQVMEANPGHYVAVFVTPTRPQPTKSSDSNTTTKPTQQRHLKLLRPDDTLHIGNVYLLVSFEEMMKEIATKKHVKLSRLMLSQRHKEKSTGKERRHRGGQSTRISSADLTTRSEMSKEEGGMNTSNKSGIESDIDIGIGIVTGSGSGRTRHGGGRWRPGLQTIAEVVGN